MNNILDKTPSELIAMVSDLDNAEIDALVAKWCEGWEYHPEGAEETLAKFMNMAWRQPLRDGYKENYFDWSDDPPAYTTDGRDAVRLLVKYHLQIGEIDDRWWVAKSLCSVCEGDEEPLAMHEEPCRAIAEAALLVALTEATEEGYPA